MEGSGDEWEDRDAIELNGDFRKIGAGPGSSAQ
jgi:hypothetical protein